MTAGLLLFTQVSVDGSYVSDLPPGFLLIGVGIGFSSAFLVGAVIAALGIVSALVLIRLTIGGRPVASGGPVSPVELPSRQPYETKPRPRYPRISS